jgi:hypothetical protein
VLHEREFEYPKCFQSANLHVLVYFLLPLKLSVLDAVNKVLKRYATSRDTWTLDNALKQ